MKAGTGLAFVIPTYQERESIIPLLTRLRSVYPGAVIFVVDDNSPDGTAMSVLEMSKSDKDVRLISRQTKQGIGPAYHEGFASALECSPSVVIQLDADGSHDPTEATRLIKPIVDGEADLVIGSRRVHGGATIGWGRLRNALSRFGSAYARLLLRIKVHDATSGYRAWSPTLLRNAIKTDTYANGYGFQIEMTWRARQLGATLVEVPISFRERTQGSSKMTASIALEAALLVIALVGRRFPGTRS